MPTCFRLLYHLHRVNHETFLFYVHHRHLLFHLLFHLFDIVPNVSLIILASLVAIIQNLILILSIHLTITRLNHCSPIFIPKRILTLTGNPTPGFLISAALSRPWDGSVHLDTTSFLVITFSFFPIFVLFCCMCSFALPLDTPLSLIFLLSHCFDWSVFLSFFRSDDGDVVKRRGPDGTVGRDLPVT